MGKRVYCSLLVIDQTGVNVHEENFHAYPDAVRQTAAHLVTFRTMPDDWDKLIIQVYANESRNTVTQTRVCEYDTKKRKWIL